MVHVLITGCDRRLRCHLAINSYNWEIYDLHANFGGIESIMHVKVKINIVVCCQFDMDFSAPISKNFDSQGMAASRAAHFPHILRASRQMTAAARHNAACRRVFCALTVCCFRRL